MQHRSLKDLRIKRRLSNYAGTTSIPNTTSTTNTASTTGTTDTTTTGTTNTSATDAAYAPRTSTRSIATIHASGYAREDAWNVCADCRRH